MPNTSNASSIAVRAGNENAATCGLFIRIRRIIVDSSPVVPRTWSRTRPSVACCHSDAICFSARSQIELAGRMVPRRRLARCAVSNAGAASSSKATTATRKAVTGVGDCRPGGRRTRTANRPAGGPNVSLMVESPAPLRRRAVGRRDRRYGPAARAPAAVRSCSAIGSRAPRPTSMAIAVSSSSRNSSRFSSAMATPGRQRKERTCILALR